MIVRDPYVKGLKSQELVRSGKGSWSVPEWQDLGWRERLGAKEQSLQFCRLGEDNTEEGRRSHSPLAPPSKDRVFIWLVFIAGLGSIGLDLKRNRKARRL